MKIRCSHVKTISILLVLSHLFSACAIQKQTLHQTDLENAYHNAVKDDLENAYHNAVKDAEKAEPSEISKNLVAIVPSNNNLVWNNKGELLVVTWTDYAGYDDKIGKSIALPKDIWITTVPEVKNFCQKLKGTKTLQLKQLLGLPPNDGKTKFVEMWVKPSDLFRPSADPEISDGEAETDFRISNKFVKVSDAYIQWFNKLKMESYGTNGYPWTRLGYTYDWGNDCHHIGLSEFVIIEGATVKINSISATLQYCQ